tara:strand:- start:1037 stop:1198 length:162 start_codon:yes stop_codon:yes gene_type:complete
MRRNKMLGLKSGEKAIWLISCSIAVVAVTTLSLTLLSWANGNAGTLAKFVWGY